MAIPREDDQSSPSDFIENSYVTYIIPFATDLNLEELFNGADDSGADFDSIEQRQSLFFGDPSL
jgi:hypothetical protein